MENHTSRKLFRQCNQVKRVILARSVLLIAGRYGVY